MPLMVWNDKLSVGIAQFDEEHKQLVALVNELFDAVQAGRSKEALGGILDSLVAYTKSHFTNEEEHFARLGYPDLDAHKAEHDALASQVLEVQRKYHAGATATLSMEVMNFLKNWLIKHIQGTDRKYGPFLRSHGLV